MHIFFNTPENNTYGYTARGKDGTQYFYAKLPDGGVPIYRSFLVQDEELTEMLDLASVIE